MTKYVISGASGSQGGKITARFSTGAKEGIIMTAEGSR